MSRSIIPETVNNGLDLRPGANNSHLTDIERTPGAVAVMEVYGKVAGNNIPASFHTSENFPGTSLTNSPMIDGLDDKAAIKFHKIADNIERNPASKCGQSAVISHCEGEAKHGHGKVLLCGVDWCPTCGKYMSAAHKHRIAGKVKKLQQLKSVGYLTIEFSDIDRYNKRLIYSAAGILNTNAIIKDIIAGKRDTKAHNKRTGGFMGRGFSRMHYFGDICINQQFNGNKPTTCKLTGKICPNNHSTKCESFVNSGKFNPHFNIVGESGFKSKNAIKKLAADIQNALHCHKVIAHYEYTTKPGKMYQILKYVMRPTFLNREWDNHFANELYDLNTSFWWGKWNGPELWKLTKKDESISLIATLFDTKNGSNPHGTCIECGAPMAKWSSPITMKTLTESWHAVEVGPDTGIYRFDWIQENNVDLTPDRVLRLHELELENNFKVNPETGEIVKQYTRTIGGNYLPKDLSDRRFERFLYQHRVKIDELKLRTCQEFDETDYFDDIEDDSGG